MNGFVRVRQSIIAKKKQREKWEKQKKNWIMTDSNVGNIGL